MGKRKPSPGQNDQNTMWGLRNWQITWSIQSKHYKCCLMVIYSTFTSTKNKPRAISVRYNVNSAHTQNSGGFTLITYRTLHNHITKSMNDQVECHRWTKAMSWFLRALLLFAFTFEIAKYLTYQCPQRKVGLHLFSEMKWNASYSTITW